MAAAVGLAGIFRGDSHYEVESGREFANLGSFERLEGNSDEFLQFGVTTTEPFVEEVLGVLLFTLDVELGCEESLISVGDRNMDVRRASGIGGWFDGAEVVEATGPG